jgi:hypothetical protein
MLPAWTLNVAADDNQNRSTSVAPVPIVLPLHIRDRERGRVAPLFVVMVCCCAVVATIAEPPVPKTWDHPTPSSRVADALAQNEMVTTLPAVRRTP